MSWIRVTREAPSDRGYEPGEVVNLGSNSAIWKQRGWGKPAEPPEEHATRQAPENAARRTERPGWEYTGSGWWRGPDGQKVRGSKNLNPEEVAKKARE